MTIEIITILFFKDDAYLLQLKYLTPLLPNIVSNKLIWILAATTVPFIHALKL